MQAAQSAGAGRQRSKPAFIRRMGQAPEPGSSAAAACLPLLHAGQAQEGVGGEGHAPASTPPALFGLSPCPGTPPSDACAPSEGKGAPEAPPVRRAPSSLGPSNESGASPSQQSRDTRDATGSGMGACNTPGPDPAATRHVALMPHVGSSEMGSLSAPQPAPRSARHRSFEPPPLVPAHTSLPTFALDKLAAAYASKGGMATSSASGQPDNAGTAGEHEQGTDATSASPHGTTAEGAARSMQGKGEGGQGAGPVSPPSLLGLLTPSPPGSAGAVAGGSQALVHAVSKDLASGSCQILSMRGLAQGSQIASANTWLQR